MKRETLRVSQHIVFIYDAPIACIRIRFMEVVYQKCSSKLKIQRKNFLTSLRSHYHQVITLVDSHRRPGKTGKAYSGRKWPVSHDSDTSVHM